MGLLRSTALLVAVVAASVGVVNKFRPHWFLLLPGNVGWIPWAVLGNPMPPFYKEPHFDPETFAKWIKPGDVVVASGTKCGTNWLLYTMHQIRTKGEGEWIDVNYHTPWMGLTHKPGQRFDELFHIMNTHTLDDGKKLKDLWDSPDYPFRVFKSHSAPYRDGKYIFPRELPVDEFRNVKFIAMSRNPDDFLGSLIAFFGEDFSKQWVKTLGGFAAKFDDDALVSNLKSGGMLYDMYLGYVKEWWRHRNDPNVLLLHYTDMKNDLIGSVRKLAMFSGVTLTSQEEERILQKVNFESMKKLEGGFDVKIYGNPDVEAVTCDNGKCPKGLVIRKGRVGSGKEEVPMPVLQKWQEAVQEDLKDAALFQWANNGGLIH